MVSFKNFIQLLTELPHFRVGNLFIDLELEKFTHQRDEEIANRFSKWLQKHKDQENLILDLYVSLNNEDIFNILKNIVRRTFILEDMINELEDIIEKNSWPSLGKENLVLVYRMMEEIQLDSLFEDIENRVYQHISNFLDKKPIEWKQYKNYYQLSTEEELQNFKLELLKQKEAIKFLESKNVVVTKLDKGVLTND